MNHRNSSGHGSFARLFIPFIFYPTILLSQPQTVWEKTYGGLRVDRGTHVALTSDGGFAVTGLTASSDHGSNDIWLFKTDAAGNLQWEKTYGGSTSEWGRTVAETPDGGFIVAGSTSSFGAGGWDAWLIRTDAVGDTLWTRCYGGPANDFARALACCTDGGWIMTGHTSSYGAGRSDMWIIRMDSLGTILWSKTYGWSQGDEAYGVQQTADGGFIITGHIRPDGESESGVCLVKLDQLGDVAWEKSNYGGAYFDSGNCVQQTTDGGYVLTGMEENSDYTRDLIIVRTDASGDQIWKNKMGGSYDESGNFVQQTPDGGFIVAGHKTDASYNRQIWVIKLDADGGTQ